ncbi:uncharacterized protein LOC144629018 [Oculina patagonica]
MASLSNSNCVVLCLVAVTVLLSEVHLTSSISPRHRDSGIVTEGVTGDGSTFRSKRSYSNQRKRLSNCRDKRNDCGKLIDKRYPSFYCSMYKRQCAVTCGVAPCLNTGKKCRDLRSGTECAWAKSWANMCRMRKYREGCLLTCCSCDKSHANCS